MNWRLLSRDAIPSAADDPMRVGVLSERSESRDLLLIRGCFVLRRHSERSEESLFEFQFGILADCE